MSAQCRYTDGSNCLLGLTYLQVIHPVREGVPQTLKRLPDLGFMLQKVIKRSKSFLEKEGRGGTDEDIS